MVNRRLTKNKFRDDLFTLKDDVDQTKMAQFQLSGITTGTTRIFTLPDIDGTFLLNLVEDTTPQLGGDLDVNDNAIINASGVVDIKPDNETEYLEISHFGSDVVILKAVGSAGADLFLKANANLRLQPDGIIEILTSGDAEDYITFSTPSDQPTISSVGANLFFVSSGGTFDFDDDFLTTSGQFVPAVGSAPAPSYSFLGNLDAGMYLTTMIADRLSFAVDGSRVFSLTSSLANFDTSVTINSLVSLIGSTSGTANKLFFQSFGTNKQLNFNLFPSGSATISRLTLGNDSDTSNYGFLRLQVSGSTASIFTNDTGTGDGVTKLQIGETVEGELTNIEFIFNNVVRADLNTLGTLQLDGDLLVDGGDIGLTSDQDLIHIADNIVLINGDLRVQGGDIGLTADTDLIQIASNSVTINGKLGLTQKAGTTTDGDLWNDSTQEALQTYVSGIEQTLVGVIFTQTADQTIADTTTETTLFGSGVGTLTLPANFWTVGKTIRIEIHGDFADTGNPTAEIQAYYGATSLIDSGAITLSGLGGTEEWACEVIITCHTAGASGALQTVIDWEYETTTGSSAIERLDVAGVLTSPIDLTAIGVLDVTFQWGTAAAANTIHSHVGFVEVLN